MLTKKNTMTTSIKNDLDRLPNLLNAKVYPNIKNTHISFYKKPVYKELKTASPGFSVLRKTKKLVLLF